MKDLFHLAQVFSKEVDACVQGFTLLFESAAANDEPFPDFESFLAQWEEDLSGSSAVFPEAFRQLEDLSLDESWRFLLSFHALQDEAFPCIHKLWHRVFIEDEAFCIDMARLFFASFLDSAGSVQIKDLEGESLLDWSSHFVKARDQARTFLQANPAALRLDRMIEPLQASFLASGMAEKAKELGTKQVFHTMYLEADRSEREAWIRENLDLGFPSFLAQAFLSQLHASRSSWQIEKGTFEHAPRELAGFCERYVEDFLDLSDPELFTPAQKRVIHQLWAEEAKKWLDASELSHDQLQALPWLLIHGLEAHLDHSEAEKSLSEIFDSLIQKWHEDYEKSQAKQLYYHVFLQSLFSRTQGQEEVERLLRHWLRRRLIEWEKKDREDRLTLMEADSLKLALTQLILPQLEVEGSRAEQIAGRMQHLLTPYENRLDQLLPYWN